MGWGIDFFNIFPNYKIPRALFTSVIWHRTWVSCFPFKACSIPWETNDMADWSQFPLKLDLLTQLDDKSSSSAWRSTTIVFCKILKKCNFWRNYCIVCFKKRVLIFCFRTEKKILFPKKQWTCKIWCNNRATSCIITYHFSIFSQPSKRRFALGTKNYIHT